MQYYGLDWMGTVLGLASIYCMGKHDQAAFVLRIAASLFWAAFGIVAHTPAAILANTVAILLCMRGISLPKGKRDSGSCHAVCENCKQGTG
jgi:hypothetical protein